MADKSSRRNFLKVGTLASAGYWVSTRPAYSQCTSPNERLNFAGIGVGGKGKSDVESMAKHGCNVVALCDVDDVQAQKIYDKFPKAKRFKDYREMFDKMHKDIDVVTVSSPDHMHAVQTMTAMKLGKHVYTQKPLCHDVYEARMLTEAAKKYGVVTQMGNQGSSEDGLRTAVEIIQSGAIGDVREVHVWTNRPVWPQGASAILRLRNVHNALLGTGKKPEFGLFGSKPAEVIKPPSSLAWDLWLGTAPYRPWSDAVDQQKGKRGSGYLPFNWRGWWDYGTGALGDMACHTANMAFRACALGYPTSVEAEMSEYNDQTFPMWSVIRYEFPARKVDVPGRGTVEMPPLKWTWYDGGNDKPAWVNEKIRKLANLKPSDKLAGSGSLIIGDKGTVFSPNDYGAKYELLPKADFAGYEPPTPWIPRVHNKHDKEFIDAIKANKPEMCYSRFEVAGPLTETVILGCVAMRARQKIEWDGPNMKITNIPEANQYLKREYRKGYEL